jgi:hypothetical protein
MGTAAVKDKEDRKNVDATDVEGDIGLKAEGKLAAPKQSQPLP